MQEEAAMTVGSAMTSLKAALRILATRTASPIWRQRNRNRPLILMFHGFTDREHPEGENGQHKHLHVNKFEAFLRFMKRHYQIISLDELVSCIEEGRQPPLGAVILTFDDGFCSNYELAYPLLKRYEAPAAIYLATEFVDEGKSIWTDRIDYAFSSAGRSLDELKAAKRELKLLRQEDVEAAVNEWELRCGARMDGLRQEELPAIYRHLDWAQVREMSGSGLVAIGAHTHMHKILGRCSLETVRWELETSRSIIEKHTDSPCLHFCYPNGSVGDFSEETESLVREAGFRSSVTTVNGRVGREGSAFLLPRLGVTNDLNLNRFDLLLSGFHSAMQQRWQVAVV